MSDSTLRLGPFTVRHYYIPADGDVAPFLEFVDAAASRGEIVGVDVESNGRPFYSRDFRLTVASFATETEVWTLDGSHRPALGVAAAALNLVAHNATYDGLALRAWTGSTPRVMADSLLAALLHAPPVDPRAKYGLKHLTAELGWTELADAEADLYGTFDDLKGGSGWARIPADSPLLIDYNALDALATRQLYVTVVRHMAPGPAALLALESRLQHVWTGATWRGMRIDRDLLADEIASLEDQIAEVRDRLADLGIDNPRSPKRLVKWFVDNGAVFSEFTDKGNPSFAAEAIPSLTAWHQPEPVRRAAALIAEFNGKSGLLSKALELDSFSVHDGRIHPTVNTLRARTGRMSVDSPALQNIPEGRLRQSLIADPGMVIVGADLAAIELRVAAALSQDRRMMDSIAAGLDLHSETARAVFGDGFTPDQRKLAKIVSFATLYGGGPNAIAKQAGIDFDAAADVRSKFFDAYPELAGFVAEVSQMTTVITPTGRRLPVPEDRGYASTNFLIQSTARDILAHACLRLVDMGYAPYLFLPIHDEILLQVPEADADEAKADLERAMTLVFEGVPVAAEAEVHGTRWGGPLDDESLVDDVA